MSETLTLEWQPSISLTKEQVARLSKRGVAFDSINNESIDSVKISNKELIKYFVDYNAKHNEPMSIGEIKKVFTDFADKQDDEIVRVPINLEAVDDMEL